MVQVDLRRRLALAADLCALVARLHATWTGSTKGLLHRDIKPRNIVVGHGDQGPLRLVDGTLLRQERDTMMGPRNGGRDPGMRSSRAWTTCLASTSTAPAPACSR